MLKEFNLGHLNSLYEGKLDYNTLVKDLIDDKKEKYAVSFKKVYDFIENVKSWDVKIVKLMDNCPIKYPKSIDNITFEAMMELRALSSRTDMSVMELIHRTVVIGCYSEYHERFNSDCYHYRVFEKLVWKSSALHMIGLFNHIMEALDESTKYWDSKFMEVNVPDEDYDLAGGQILSQFNIIKTVKATCVDFNVPYREAWQMSYAVTQTNSLEKASSYFIQHKMTKIKEAKMKASRTS